MSFDVKKEILSAIAKTDAPETKTLLLLMLGVLEEIGGRIDNFLTDEKKIREAVLNGHEASHHEHHNHIARCMEVDGLKVCAWVKQQMDDEAQSDRDRKSVVQKFLEGAAAHAGSVIAGGALMWGAVHFLK